jgi:hypothetical protein
MKVDRTSDDKRLVSRLLHVHACHLRFMSHLLHVFVFRHVMHTKMSSHFSAVQAR